MKLKELTLFPSYKELFYFFSLSIFILSYSLLIEFHNYKKLTEFDSYITNATVLKQYTKSKLTKRGKTQHYQVLKLLSERDFSFYTTASATLENVVGKQIELEIWPQEVTFYDYVTHFYAFSKIIQIKQTLSLKERLNDTLSTIHTDTNATNIYQALYTATQLPPQLQSAFSTLGVSHLFAISGFHLGVLGGVLLFVLKYPYQFFQSRYFPYTNARRDLFIFIAFLLLLYLLFLDSPPSLLRAFAMLLIGFFLYDRGYKIISMQTLLLTVILLLAFFPKLFFALGFWLSVAGVFYIFLFLLHFSHLSKVWQFILIPFWVYLMMLPYSLSIFANFSVYHPLSIVWTSLFTLFYPLSIFLHFIGFGDFFDGGFNTLLELAKEQKNVELSTYLLYTHLLLSLICIYKKSFLTPLITFAIFVLLYSLYQIK